MKFNFNRAVEMAKAKANLFLPIDLNEGNVQAIFNRCLATDDTPKGKETTGVLFSRATGFSGEDVKIIYFDIAITNYDPNSAAGAQTVVLKDCSIDGGILAKFDVDGEFLEEDMDFTFEDFEMPEKFTLLEGMAQ